MVEIKNKLNALREENRNLRQQIAKNKIESGEIDAEQDRSLYNLLQEYMMENQSLRTSNKVEKTFYMYLLIFRRSFDRRHWTNRKFQWRIRSQQNFRSWKKAQDQARSRLSPKVQEWARNSAAELLLLKRQLKPLFNQGIEASEIKRKQSNRLKNQWKWDTVICMRRGNHRRTLNWKMSFRRWN